MADGPEKATKNLSNDMIDLTDSSTNVVGTRNVKDVDLFVRPMRFARPDNIFIILRGLPGSGKKLIAQNIEKLEQKYSKSCKIIDFDEYFVTAESVVCTKHLKTFKNKRPVFVFAPENTYLHQKFLSDMILLRIYRRKIRNMNSKTRRRTSIESCATTSIFALQFRRGVIKWLF